MPYYEVELDNGSIALVRANNVRDAIDRLFYGNTGVAEIESVKRVRYNLVVID